MNSSMKKRPIPWSSEAANVAAAVAAVEVGAAVVAVAVLAVVGGNRALLNVLQCALTAYGARCVARASSARARAIASASPNSTDLPSASLVRAARIASKAPGGVGTGCPDSHHPMCSLYNHAYSSVVCNA